MGRTAKILTVLPLVLEVVDFVARRIRARRLRRRIDRVRREIEVARGQ